MDVNVPDALLGRLGQLLQDFEAFVVRRGFITRRVKKPPGGHVTPWWLYVRMDDRAPSRSFVQFGETRHDEVNPVPHLWTRAKEAYRKDAMTLLRAFMAAAEWRATLPPPPHRPPPRPFKVALASFEPAEYGTNYLALSEGDCVEGVDAPAAGQGWAYGRIVSTEGRRSEPGWHPPPFVR